MWLPDSRCISLRENNVFISYVTMLGYEVLYVDNVDLPLDCLSQGPI